MGSWISASVSTFFNHYDDLRSLEFNPVTLLPLCWGNMMEGNTYGVEAWGNYQATAWCLITLAYTQMHEVLRFEPGSSGLLGIQQAGDDPSHQISLRSSMNLTPELNFAATLRQISSLPNPAVPAYTELNASLRWSVSRSLRISASSLNLLQAHHVEFSNPPNTVELGRLSHRGTLDPVADLRK